MIAMASCKRFCFNDSVIMTNSVFHPRVYIEHMFQSRFLLVYGKSLPICVPSKGKIEKVDIIS